MTQRVDQLQSNLDILVRKGRTAALWYERPQQAEVFLLWHPQRADATVNPDVEHQAITAMYTILPNTLRFVDGISFCVHLYRDYIIRS